MNRNLFTLVEILVLASVYFVVARVGLSLEPVSGVATLIWPPAGISLAALFLFGYRLWPGIALGAFLAYTSFELSLFASLGMSGGNVLEALAGVYFLRRFLPGFQGSLNRVQDVLGFIIVVGLASPLIGATIGVTSALVGDVVAVADYPDTWIVRLLGDGVGALVVAPLLLTWRWDGRRDLLWNLEFAAMLALTIAVTYMVFGGVFVTHGSPIRSYLVFPLLIWAALRFGQRETVWVIFAITAIAVFGTASYHGPFISGAMAENLTNLSMFLAVIAVAGLLLTAAVTERKDAEARFRRVIESSPNAIVMVDRNGTIHLVNAQVEQLFGYRREELIGQQIEMLVPERFRDSHRTDRSVFFTNPTARPMGAGRDLYGLHKEQHEFPIEVGLSPMTSDGQMFVLASINDITERKQEEQTIRLLAHAVQSTSEMISITDLEDRFVFVNSAFLKKYGYEEEEILGKQPDIVRASGNDQVTLREISDQTRRGGWIGEVINKRKDGSQFPILLSTSPVKGERGEIIGLIGVAIDISGQKHAERALHQAEARFRSMYVNPIETAAGTSQREEKSDRRSTFLFNTFAKRIDDITKRMRESVRQTLSFSSLASHELRTPLTIIRQQLEDALQIKQSAVKRRKVIVGVYDEILRLTRMVNDLLSLSTMYAGTFKLQTRRIDFHDVLKNFYDEAMLLSRDKKISVVLSPGPPAPIKGDVDRLRQVLFNLLDNAVRHTPERGRIHLEFDVRGNEVVFQFKDSGTGIAADRLTNIFNPFYRTDSGGHGTGLGLALVKLIVEAHKGTVNVTSSKGQGTTFFMRLPLADR